jgi:hypothetical protein
VTVPGKNLGQISEAEYRVFCALVQFFDAADDLVIPIRGAISIGITESQDRQIYYAKKIILIIDCIS